MVSARGQNAHALNSAVASPSLLRQTGAMQDASTHGHALLNYIIDHGGQVEFERLRDWARSAHGEQARYHTCSVEGLALDEILQFLAERQKIALHGTMVSVNAQNICGHEEHTCNGSHG